MFKDPFAQKKRKRTLTSADKKRIASKQGWKCRKCKKTLPTRYHIDHIKEFSQGGSDRPSNLQALCPNCHAEKTEQDRHKKKLKKIREKEVKGHFGGFLSTILGESPKRRQEKNILDIDLVSRPKKKRRKKKKDDLSDMI